MPHGQAASNSGLLLILESNIGGHRASYIQRIVSEAVRRNLRVALAMPAENFNHRVIKKMLSDYQTSQFQAIKCEPVKQSILTPPNTFSLIMNEYFQKRFYQAALIKASTIDKPDAVLLTSFDSALNALSLFGLVFGGNRWVGIVMRQSFHYTDVGIKGPSASTFLKIKKHLFLRLLKQNKTGTIMTIDPSLMEYVNHKHPQLTRNLHYLPDPAELQIAEDTPDLRSTLNIPGEASVILIYGSILVGKGSRYLLEVIVHLDKNVHVILAGKQHPKVRFQTTKFLEKNPNLSNRIHQIDRYIDESEEASIFKSATIVWLGYSGHYAMSGVLIQAARCHLPVIATDEGLIGWLTEKFKIGVVTDTTNMERLKLSINHLIDNKHSFGTENFKNFYQQHTLEKFYEALFAQLTDSASVGSKSSHNTEFR